MKITIILSLVLLAHKISTQNLHTKIQKTTQNPHKNTQNPYKCGDLSTQIFTHFVCQFLIVLCEMILYKSIEKQYKKHTSTAM